MDNNRMSTDEIAEEHERRRDRDQRLIQKISGPTVPAVAASAIGAAVLLELSRIFHETADRHERSTRRGAKGMSTQYRQAAALVAGVGQSLERRAREPQPEPTISDPEPAITVTEVFDVAPPLPAEEIERRAEVGRQVAAYIRGDVNEIVAPELQPILIPAHEIGESMTIDPFTDPAPIRSNGYAGRRLTIDELMTAEPEFPSPDHRSVSQLNDFSDCGLKYRIARRTSGITQPPAWWNVGGNALHAAIEELERAQVTGAIPAALPDLWKHHIGQAITDTYAAAPGISMDDWRAARGGAENFTWWLVEGSEMLNSYVNMRAEADRIDPGRRLLRAEIADGSTLALEWPFELSYGSDLNQTIQGVIDQAWLNSDGSVEIVDLKFGTSTPADTFQLGVYAHALLTRWPWNLRRVDPLEVITGRYWLGRKAQFSEPVNLLERHSWEEIVYRFRNMDAADRANIHTPRPSSYCRSCGVRGACPIGGRS